MPVLVHGGSRFADSTDILKHVDTILGGDLAPALFPPECRAVQPALAAVPDAMREEILRFRKTDAGQFALRMFSQERTSKAC